MDSNENGKIPRSQFEESGQRKYEEAKDVSYEKPRPARTKFDVLFTTPDDEQLIHNIRAYQSGEAAALTELNKKLYRAVKDNDPEQAHSVLQEIEVLHRDNEKFVSDPRLRDLEVRMSHRASAELADQLVTTLMKKIGRQH